MHAIGSLWITNKEYAMLISFVRFLCDALLKSRDPSNVKPTTFLESWSFAKSLRPRPLYRFYILRVWFFPFLPSLPENVKVETMTSHAREKLSVRYVRDPVEIFPHSQFSSLLWKWRHDHKMVFWVTKTVTTPLMRRFDHRTSLIFYTTSVMKNSKKILFYFNWALWQVKSTNIPIRSRYIHGKVMMEPLALISPTWTVSVSANQRIHIWNKEQLIDPRLLFAWRPATQLESNFNDRLKKLLFLCSSSEDSSSSLAVIYYEASFENALRWDDPIFAPSTFPLGSCTQCIK